LEQEQELFIDLNAVITFSPIKDKLGLIVNRDIYIEISRMEVNK